MPFPLSSALASRLVEVPRTGSTNDDLVAAASADPASWPDLSVLVTLDQTGGRGRLGRVWVAPPGQTVAASVVLRPRVALERWGWFPLIAGLAMTEALHELIPGREVGLKWPNDVQIGGRKVSGLLGELLPDAAGIVMGSGVNLTIAQADLPTPTATSVLLEGGVTDADVVLSTYLGRLADLAPRAGTAGLRAEISAACTTLGRRVKVQLPGSDDLVGIARELDASGRLVVEPESGGPARSVAAGDVTHLRYE